MKKKEYDIAAEVEAGVNPLVIVDRQRRELEISLRPFLDGRDYDEQVIILEIKALDHVEKVSMIEKGRRLLALKEHNTPVRFAEICEEIQMSRRRAYESIAMAIKFGDHPSLLNLSDSKLKELQSLSDEDIEKLEKGKLHDKGVDDVELMTVPELRDLVRKRRDSDKNLRTQVNNLKQRNLLLEERVKDKDRIDEAVKSDLMAMYIRLIDVMGDFKKTLANTPQDQRDEWSKKMFSGLLGNWNDIVAMLGVELASAFQYRTAETNFRPKTAYEEMVDDGVTGMSEQG